MVAIQRQQVGLSRDGVDQIDDISDPGRRLRQLADAIGRGARLTGGLAGYPG
jgi:hypothetical protein